MDFAVPAEHQQAPHNATHNVDHALPPVMAAIPDALEGMQLAQDFTGSAQQLQADMDALRLSLETLDFGRINWQVMLKGVVRFEFSDSMCLCQAVWMPYPMP